MNLNPTPTISQMNNNTIANNSGNSSAIQGTISGSSLASSAVNTLANAAADGQLLSGEIVDIRRGEINVRLTNKELVTLSMPENMELTRGQSITFQVTASGNNQFEARILPPSTAPVNTTILQALQAAGLPAIEQNQTIVRELLNQQMSIDKQSIQNMFRLSLANKNASISSLVLMTKLNIPITEANVTQFENYRNYEHRIIKEIETLSNTVPSLVDASGNLVPAKEVLGRNQQLLQILLPQKTEGTLGDKLPSQTIHTPSAVTSTAAAVPAPLALTPGQSAELLSLMSRYPMPAGMQQAIQNGTANPLDVQAVLNKDYELAVIQDEQQLDQLMQQEEVNPATLKLSRDDFQSSIVGTVADQVRAFQQENGQIAAFLSPASRQSLLNQLSFLPMSPQEKQAVLSGTMPTKVLLLHIQTALAGDDAPALQKLLGSDEYKGLLKEHMLSNWTLSPKALAKEGAVPELYEKMYQQLAELKDMTEHAKAVLDTLTGNTLHKLDQDLSATRQNLDFMKTLNDLFTYVQLPIRLKDKTLHSDLYVYTNKKDLKRDPGNVSALLHLDMDYLGSMDVHVNLNHKSIHTKFYLESQETVDLVSQFVPELEASLIQKGYLVHSEVQKKEHIHDFVEDFLEQGSSNASMQRYSFDIRA